MLYLLKAYNPNKTDVLTFQETKMINLAKD